LIIFLTSTQHCATNVAAQNAACGSRMQALVRAGGTGGGSGPQQPSELTLKLHDLSEAVGKLRGQVQKADKRAGGADAGVAELTAQLATLAARVEEVAALHRADPAAMLSSNPLFVEVRTAWFKSLLTPPCVFSHVSARQRLVPVN
jgi:hypothetical protein